jgi:hypothetical protein
MNQNLMQNKSATNSHQTDHAQMETQATWTEPLLNVPVFANRLYMNLQLWSIERTLQPEVVTSGKPGA